MSGEVRITMFDDSGEIQYQNSGSNAIMRTGVRSILEGFFIGTSGGLVKKIEFGTDYGLGTRENPTPITPTTVHSEFELEFSYELEAGAAIRTDTGKYQITTFLTAVDFIDDFPILRVNSVRLINERDEVFAWRRVEFFEIGADRTAVVEWKFNFGETCADVN